MWKMLYIFLMGESHLFHSIWKAMQWERVLVKLRNFVFNALESDLKAV